MSILNFLKKSRKSKEKILETSNQEEESRLVLSSEEQPFSKRIQNNIPIKETKPICPYCKNVLEKAPKRKKKCPFCKNQIYVKPKQNLFTSIYLTEEQITELNEFESVEHFKYKQESEKVRLLGYKKSRCKKVQIISMGNCEACNKLNDKILPIDEALEKMPIPVRACTYKHHGEIPRWCMCRYVAVVE